MIAAVENIKTGTEWMPIVPEHWQMIRVKNLFNEIDKRSVTGKEDLLSVSQYTGVTLRKDSFEEGKEITNAKTLKGYKIVEQGDLVVNIMLAWNGCLGISSYNGITSPAYCVYRVKNEQELNPEYFGYLFSTSLYKGEFRKRSTGIIESRLRLYSDAFFRIFCFVPPKKEQDKIVNLINSESAKITHFIQTKQRFIELLKEQRQSIITNAVTKGIDDGVKMKGRGIDWIGHVPIHWEIRRFKNVCQLQRGHDLPKEQFKEGEFPVYGSNGIIGYHKKYTTKSPCITIGRSGSVGEINFVEKNFWAHNTCLFVKENYKNDWEYLFFLISSIDIKMVSNGSAVPTLDRNNIHSLRVPYPPTVEEQKQIVEHIKSETRTLDIAISKAEREIELIKEYREAMIAEAVTGKMKL